MLEKHFVKQAMNKLELDKYLTRELDRAGFTKSEIVKTPLVTRIVVNVTRPGLAIGKSGANIQQLTETIEKKFGIDNPQLEIKEIEKPELDAKAVANKVKALIERGFSWRSVVFKAVNEIQASGAQGLEIILSGKITGKAGRKRSQRIAHGYMKKVGEQAKLVDYGQASAYPKIGAIGIKVKIVRPETVFPDKEKMKDYIKTKEEAAVSGEEGETTGEEAEKTTEGTPEETGKAEGKEKKTGTEKETAKKPAEEEKQKEAEQGEEKPKENEAGKMGKEKKAETEKEEQEEKAGKTGKEKEGKQEKKTGTEKEEPEGKTGKAKAEQKAEAGKEEEKRKEETGKKKETAPGKNGEEK